MKAVNGMKARQTGKVDDMFTKLKSADYRIDLEATVLNAAVCVSPVWPIETFIACNPLQGFESQPFEAACHAAYQQLALFDNPVKLEAVNREMIKWCASFLDAGQATIGMPNRERGFYAAFIDLAVFDSALHQNKKNTRNWIRGLPNEPIKAIALCLERLGIAPDGEEDFFKETFSYLPGFAGYVKWQSLWQGIHHTDHSKQMTLIDFMAVRLIITCLLWPEAAQKMNRQAAVEPIKKQIETMVEAEKKYSDGLITRVLSEAMHLETKARTRPDAQMVCCIDVRSEPFRRQLESCGLYETIGFAGFFGLPVRLYDYNTEKACDACPVLLKPRFDIYEKPIETHVGCIERHRQGRTILKQLKRVYDDLKYNFSTPFSLVESIGFLSGLMMMAKTLAPTLTQRIRHWIHEAIMPTLPTEPIITPTSPDTKGGISEAYQLQYAEAVLTMMGLTDGFAKLVLLCGHGSTTQNNPYASALDCGACGGNHGGANAKLLAAILNTPSIRTALIGRGIVIPDDTVFIAAEHNTTTDEVTLYEGSLPPTTNRQILHQLKHDLALARRMNTKQRCRAFGMEGDYNSEKKTRERSNDWSEVRPEWGLARNAAFIIGPRMLTEGLDLDGRCFLHSYAWQQDESGSSLETILTAPMIVAEWINTQYLFSTWDNIAFGSGSKITHNVTGKIGVMQGNASDLMHGLPLQSVMRSDNQAFHEPQRLLVIVYAPLSRITMIIQRQSILKKLFLNGWVNLMAIDPATKHAYQFSHEGDWRLTTTGETDDSDTYQS